MALNAFNRTVMGLPGLPLTTGEGSYNLYRLCQFTPRWNNESCPDYARCTGCIGIVWMKQVYVYTIC